MCYGKLGVVVMENQKTGADRVEGWAKKRWGVNIRESVCSGYFLGRNDDVYGHLFSILEERSAHESHGHLMILAPRSKR